MRFPILNNFALYRSLQYFNVSCMIFFMLMRAHGTGLRVLPGLAFVFQSQGLGDAGIQYVCVEA